MFGRLDDVLDGDQPTQFESIINHQHALQTMDADQLLALLDRCAFFYRHQPLARRHDVADRLIKMDLKAQIAVGDDANHLFAFEYRKTGNPVLARKLGHFLHGHLRRDGDRVFQNPRLKAFDLGDFRRLLLRAQVFMHDPDTALLCQGDGQTSFRHGIHGGGKQRQIEHDVA